MYIQWISPVSPAISLSHHGDDHRIPSRHQLLEKWLPFLTSLLLHVAVICIGIIIFKAAGIVYRDYHNPDRAPAITPESAVVPEGQTSLPTGLKSDPRPLSQALLPQVTTAGWNVHPDSAEFKKAMSAGGPGDVEMNLIANGPHTIVGIGRKIGPFSGAGDDNGPGSAARFGKGGLGGSTIFQPRVGSGDISNSQRIVFICDASGSMMSTFDDLRIELHKAIAGLRPISSYNVIFFQETDCKAIDPHRLLLANTENKRRGVNFVDAITPRGTTDPIPALQAAFAMNPQMVFLLTDGDFPNNQAVMDKISKLESRHAVVINTIAFIEHNESYEKLLHKIADDTHGSFRFVSEADLGQ